MELLWARSRGKSRRCTVAASEALWLSRPTPQPLLAFSNYLLMSGLHVSPWPEGGRGGRMSGSLLRCLQEAGLWLDLRQHLCNRSCLSQMHIRFPCKLSEIFFGESFPPGVFGYLPTSSRFAFHRADLGPVCTSTYSFLHCERATLLNNNCSHDLIVYM